MVFGLMCGRAKFQCCVTTVMVVVLFLNASKYCGSVLKNDFDVLVVVVVLVLVADELL